ncbi:Uncharacterized protein SCF082_LOCUS42470 [Durusdinium trenchii]|uniref:Uncharacterized protein n=1 Tax=Durusdinium trenchii TaxID=1381693 RepID=A0ABP0QQA4_9DINO
MAVEIGQLWSIKWKGEAVVIPEDLVVVAAGGQCFLKIRASHHAITKLICTSHQTKNMSLAGGTNMKALVSTVHAATFGRPHDQDQGNEDDKELFQDDGREKKRHKKMGPAEHPVSVQITLPNDAGTLDVLWPASKRSDVAILMEPSNLEICFNFLEHDCADCAESGKRTYYKSGKKTTQLLTGAWLLTDALINGIPAIKKKDSDLWLWCSPANAAWYISAQCLSDGVAWPNMECYCKILDKDKSPSGEIFIPHNSKVAAEWVLTSATVFVAKMSHSLVGRFKGSQVMYAELQKQYDALKAENDQLKLEIAQAELAKDCTSAKASSSGVPAPLMPPPPPRAPDFGPYGKGKVEHEGGKGQKGSASAMWMAGQSGNKVPSGWKNYMVPLIGVPGLNHTTWSHCTYKILS